VFGSLITSDDRIIVALKECKGPYRTTKAAIVSIFANCYQYGVRCLQLYEIEGAIWHVENQIQCKGQIPRDRIHSAIRSLLYENKIQSAGGGGYTIHERHLPELLPNSAYNKAKLKIAEKEKQRKERPSFVYFVQWENDPDSVKIGYSTNPVERFRSFLTACPHKLVVLRVQKAHDQDDERILHERFESYRKRGEWFNYQGRLREYIESIDTSVVIEIGEQLTEKCKEDLFTHYF